MSRFHPSHLPRRAPLPATRRVASQWVLQIALAAAVGATATAQPATKAGGESVICSGQPIPKGWVVVGYRQTSECDGDPLSPSATDTTRDHFNAYHIQRLADAKGDTLRVCYLDSLPDDWAIIRRVRADSACGRKPPGLGPTSYVIRRFAKEPPATTPASPAPCRCAPTPAPGATAVRRRGRQAPS